MKRSRTIVFAAALIIVVISCVMLCDILYADEGMLDRCRPYEQSVKAMLIQEGVSPDYFYLMVAESGCRNGATSNKGAIGFWQLMPATSRSNGCSDPNNLECATVAAARYIRSLEKRFDLFEEVVMAYNMGGSNLKRLRKPTNEATSLAARVRRLRNLDKKREE